MYHINTKVDKPDIGYMEATIDKSLRRGIKIKDCSKLLEYYTNLQEQYKRNLYSKYGILNPNSSPQVIQFIKSVSREISLESSNDIINVCYNDEEDKWTANGEALGKLADLGYEFARDILDYRHAKKYAETIKSITSWMDSERMIHPKISLGKTNRINYSDPGLLNIHKKLLWNLVEARTEGNVLYSVDIKNQEPGILINMTNAEDLKPALYNAEGLYETLYKQCFTPKVTANILIDTLPENRQYSISELKQLGTISPATYSIAKPLVKELYCDNSRVVAIETVCIGSEKGIRPALPNTVSVETEDGRLHDVAVAWEDYGKKYNRNNDYSVLGSLKGLELRVSKAERKEFKTAWIAMSYGASAFGVDHICKIIDGKTVYNFISKINGLKDYRARISDWARQNKTTICTLFGTPLYAGSADNTNKLKRVLLDLPIQGTGADILSLLIKRFDSYVTENGLTGKLELYYTRHDELIIEVDRAWLDEVGDEQVCAVLRDMLEHQIDDWVPFKLEISQTVAADLDFEDDEE